MGVVYVVFDHRDRNVLALKTFRRLAAENSSEQRALEHSFEKEASAWIALDRHPYIVRARWVQRLHRQLYIGMDYIAPDERQRNMLRHYLVGEPLPLVQALRWGIEFCHGMEHALGKGVLCHRDIKPDNILISNDGHVKIADFGLAAALDHRGADESGGGWAAMPSWNSVRSGLTVMPVGKGQVGGTPGYIAPEVLRGEGADVRSDVYSFGVVLYQMVTGNPGVRLVNRYELAPLERVDSVLWPVIERCLMSQARSRYPSFRLLRGELEGLVKKAGGAVVAPPEIKELATWEWSNKGVSLSSLGRYQDAVVCYDKALQIDPSHAGSWHGKGFALSNLGRKEEAFACYDRALEIDPRYAALWYDKGTDLSSLGCKKEAVACFDWALKLDPSFKAAWCNKGNALLDLGRREEAITCYDRALEVDPRYAAVWCSKGIALSTLARNQEAIACFDRALEIDPRFVLGWSNKGTALSDLGRYQDAVVCYDRVLEIDPRFAIAWHNKGIALSRLGRNQEANACLSRALEIDPSDAMAWYDKGTVLSRLGCNQEAIPCFDRALEIDPRFAIAWYNKGNALLALAHKREAVEAYRRFIVYAPATYQQHIQRIRQLIAELEADPSPGK
jgi:tetratricopeptide (TPR) repeat protein